ncbi:MAG: DUF4038 domain-containing protein [Eubacteriales bacterium]|nr:DUF4038 domain-containing protein [Eubacteriales bacterium]
MQKAFCFPIRINRQGGYFEDQTGRPFLWHGDTCWRIFWMMSYEEACVYLEDRAAKGFTVIQTHMLPHHVYQTNVYGANPFVRPGQMDLLNEAYFANVDRVISYANTLGLAIAIAPMWLSVWEDDWHRLYHGEPLAHYSKAIAERYGRCENVIAFIHGGDDDALALHEEIRKTVPLFKQMAPNVFNTFHAGIGPSYPFFGDNDWYDFCMNYTYDYDSCVRQMLEARKRYPNKPALLAETHYDGNDGITPEVIRKFAYTSLLLGGCGQTYGNKDLWMANMFWPDALWSAAAQHMMTLREIADRLPWYLMKPDFSGHWVHTVRSLMPGASDAYIPAACTEDECELAAYVSDRRYFTVEIMKDAQGEWIDPVSGRVFCAKTIRYNEKDVLQIPGRNAGGNDDWLLHMKK